MQAPTTTEGGPAGRDPQAPTCPACGAANTATAAFCWQCYRAFGAGPSTAYPPPPGGPATWPPAPAPPGTLTAPRRSHLGVLGPVVAVAIGVAAAVIAFVALRGGDVAFPEAFAGLERSTDEVSEAASASFRTASEAGGLDADMAFYEEADVPLVALAYLRWTEGVPGGADEAFDAFADGLTSGASGVTISQRSDRTVGGVDYLCASVSAGLGAGLCVWQDEDVFWMLMDVRPGARVGQTQRLAVTAHDATS